MRGSRGGPWGRARCAAGLTALCAVLLAACGGSSGPQASNQVGSGDKAICSVISQATVAYDAKHFDTWSADMDQVANMASSAQNSAIKTAADRIKQAQHAPETHGKGKGSAYTGLLGGVAGFTELKDTCARLHL